MRVVALLLLLIVVASCGGNLSDEQRKKMRERMSEDEIKRVTKGELMEAAFQYGRAITSSLEKTGFAVTDKTLIDSLQSAYNVKIYSIQPGDSALLGIESKVIEAYTGAPGAPIADDVQSIGTDSLLYTRPIMRERPDGSTEFTRAISIHMPVKSVILSIKD